LRPPALYRSPLPRTKLEATVPDGQVTGLLEVSASQGLLTAGIPAPGARLQLSVAAGDDATVVVPYTDPRGGSRTVSHAALASVELTFHRRGDRELSLSTSTGVYEYGTRKEMPGVIPQPLPEG
jgi:hypothetical protein